MNLQNFLFQKLNDKLGFDATECQLSLFTRLSKFISSSDNDIFLLKGYAGTGKTSALGTLVKLLQELDINVILLAPTGRSAKVFASYSEHKAFTIHKHIYRQKSITDGIGTFVLNQNQNRDTFYIVDEASLISDSSLESNTFGSGRLLDDLIIFIRSNQNNKLILSGDPAQLPPIGLDQSPALNISNLILYGGVEELELKSVVRQSADSGILYNATHLRKLITSGDVKTPGFKLGKFSDIVRISGSDLIESLSDSYSKYGKDETVVLCRSNKRANRYNEGIRAKIDYREDDICKGDKLMVVKNCYQFLEAVENIDFIANGDIAELIKISKREERYGLHFAEAQMRFSDYDDFEIKAKVILDTLTSEGASLGIDAQRALFNGVLQDYSHIKGKRKRYSSVREDLYFNALQIKFAQAITVHKSQGGQWKAVYIDNPFWKDDISLDDLKWLYTALTRASEKIFFVNFDNKFFKN